MRQVEACKTNPISVTATLDLEAAGFLHLITQLSSRDPTYHQVKLLMSVERP
jgi:hypothetical protein